MRGEVRQCPIPLCVAQHLFLCASVNIKSPMKPRGIQLFEKGLAVGAKTEERALW